MYPYHEAKLLPGAPTTAHLQEAQIPPFLTSPQFFLLLPKELLCANCPVVAPVDIPRGLPAQMIGVSCFLLALCWGWTCIPGYTWSGFLQPLAAQLEAGFVLSSQTVWARTGQGP